MATIVADKILFCYVSKLYYNRFDIRSSHYAVNKALSGVKMLPDRSFPFVESDRIITVAYHRIVVWCSNSATGVEIVKKERFRRGFYCNTIF